MCRQDKTPTDVQRHRMIKWREETKKKPFPKERERFSPCMWWVFGCDCAVFFLVCPRPQWLLTVPLFNVPWRYWNTSVYIYIQTVAHRLVFKNSLNEFQGELIFSKKKKKNGHDPWSLPDPLSAVVLYQILLKHSTEAVFIQTQRVQVLLSLNDSSPLIRASNHSEVKMHFTGFSVVNGNSLIQFLGVWC